MSESEAATLTDTTPLKASNRSLDSVTVVIPALNEAHRIGACLDGVASLDANGLSVDVVVVDNGSTDNTVEVVRSFQHRLRIHVIELRGVYISGMRNAGANVARGTLIAFLDADCIPRPDWLQLAVTTFQQYESKVVVGGDYLVPPNSSWVARAWYQDRTAAKAGSVNYLPSGNLIFRRTEFVGLGGFDEQLQTNEDSELCNRARSKGFRVIAEPRLAVIHLGTPQTLAQFFRKQRWHGTHVFRVFLRSGAKENTRPVLLAVSTVVFAALLLVSLVLQNAVWSTVFAVLLLAPSVLLSVRFVLATRKWRSFFPLTVLTLTYAAARAVCIATFRPPKRG